jgi:hypothetical protein
MFCLKPEARNLELVKTGNRGFRSSKTSATNRIHFVPSVYKDEALVEATLRGLPGLLASLESFRE